ncbi:hypothetical protein NPIL_114941 [Nephila pilipes]|uniref:Uncharacterized protein n=1 Tax=Nephila pilipes TaxID=299642 RepID=A0A8X6Q9R9_NEPPI|nr:hypothetical protein NPIL_114941 [Nephila pilipes]
MRRQRGVFHVLPLVITGWQDRGSMSPPLLGDELHFPFIRCPLFLLNDCGVCFSFMRETSQKCIIHYWEVPIGVAASVSKVVNGFAPLWRQSLVLLRPWEDIGVLVSGQRYLMSPPAWHILFQYGKV